MQQLYLRNDTEDTIRLDSTGATCDDATTLKDYFKKFFEVDSGFWSTSGTDIAKSFFGLSDAEVTTELASFGADVHRVSDTSIPTLNDETDFTSAFSP